MAKLKLKIKKVIIYHLESLHTECPILKGNKLVVFILIVNIEINILLNFNTYSQGLINKLYYLFILVW